MNVTKKMIENYARIRVEAALYVIGEDDPSERKRIEFENAINKAEAAIDAALSAQPATEPEKFFVGEQTTERVFKSAGLTNLSDLQAVLDAVEKALSAQPVAVPDGLPENCDGKEQYAFEEWAKAQRYDMQEHPLHYIFLEPKTNAAREGWNAAISYCRKQVLAAAFHSKEGE